MKAWKFFSTLYIVMAIVFTVGSFGTGSIAYGVFYAACATIMVVVRLIDRRQFRNGK